MSRLKLFGAVALACALLAFGVVYASPAAPSLQQAPTPFPTPTPNEAGDIIYVVQPRDTAWRIAALADISVEELYALNGLQPTDFLTEGTRLLLGKGGPTRPTAIPGTEPTATVIPPSPTPVEGSGQICGLLFEDTNGNAQLDSTEPGLAGGQVNVADASGEIAGESTTEAEPAGTDLIGSCFDGLEGGDYNVSAAVPEGFNPTTSMNAPVRLQPGEIKYVEFGAQPSAALAGGVETGDSGTSTLLGVVGVVFLLAAGTLAYYAARWNRRSPRSLR
ncbi:MAG: LysM peptidoglycan-binding domain-containing protein [Anaerolineales bacterium]